MNKSYSQILADLLKSKARGNVIAVKAKGTEKPMLSTVNDVRANTVVILNPISVYGAPLDDHIFHIEDIENVKIYSALYTDPVYVRIRELKNSIDEIRRSLRW